MTEHVHLEFDHRVLTITLDRQEVKNALTHDMYSALADALEEAGSNDDVRCVLITGAGDIFTAGNDLGDFASPLPAGKLPVLRFLETLRDFEKPVIVAVNGAAIGIGLTLLLHCDLVFAGENATFSAPFTRLGLVPEAGSSLLLPRAVGNAMANDILLAGRVLNASEALVAGLVSRVAPHERLSELATEVAHQVAGFAPNAVRESKRLIRGDRDRVADQMRREERVFFAQLESSEFSESLLAMREKRPPVFDPQIEST
jgi:enoyl-CoA hydratase/carnithine racemase